MTEREKEQFDYPVLKASFLSAYNHLGRLIDYLILDPAINAETQFHLQQSLLAAFKELDKPT